MYCFCEIFDWSWADLSTFFLNGKPVSCIHIGYAFIIEYVSSFFLLSLLLDCAFSRQGSWHIRVPWMWILTCLSLSSVQSLNRVWHFATPWTAARQASLSITSSWSLLKLMSIELVLPPNHLVLSSPSPPAFSLSQHQGLFKWVSSSHQVAKYWSFSFSISLSNEYLGLISFRSDWFDLLAVWGTLKNLLQHHSSKAYVLQRSAFFLWSHSHIHTWLLEKP